MTRYWRKYRILIVKAILLILFGSIAQVLFDFLKGALLDQAIDAFALEFRWLSYALLGLAVIKSVAFYGFTTQMKYFSVNSISDMRQGIFASLLRSGYPRFIKRKAGEIVSLYTNQLDVVEQSYFNSFYGSFQIIGSLVLSLAGLFYINWKLALLAAFLLIPPILVPRLLKKKLSESLKRRLNALEKSTGSFSQWMEASEIINSYQADQRFVAKFKSETEDVQRKTEQYNRLAYFSHSLAMLLTQLGLMALIAYSANQVLQGELSVGSFLTVIALMEEMQGQVIYQAGYLQSILSSRVATAEILETVDEQMEQPTQIINPPVRKIHFQNVSFSYDSAREILRDVSLTLDQKGIYLITGESGSGKSTAMNLLAGYHQPEKGCVRINEIPAHEIANLADLLTVMRQETVFFNDTLRNNLAMYQTADDQEILAKMRCLGLTKYAETDYLDREMNYSGDQFSGGEARRLSLVRSLLKPSEILILDEPLANVDEETIQKMIHLIMAIKDQYVLIVTHQVPAELAEEAIKVISF